MEVDMLAFRLKISCPKNRNASNLDLKNSRALGRSSKEFKGTDGINQSPFNHSTDDKRSLTLDMMRIIRI
jgi:hypothetical protein